jgi:hypothetical protein
MKIISSKESRQILRNLYRKEAMEKRAAELRHANGEERARLLQQIEREVEERLRGQTVSGK